MQGSLASQLARALTQAGILDVWSSPLWGSSSWLSADSALGTLLHALVGYDAQSSGVQLLSYLGVLAFIYAGTRFMIGRQIAATT